MQEDLPAGRAVDTGGLVVGVGDRNEACVSQQGDEAGPVPDIHDDQREPGVQRIAFVIVSEVAQHHAHKADVDAAEHLPDHADDIPWNQQRQRHQHEAGGHAPPFARHVQRDEDAERDLDGEDDAGEDEIAPKRVPEFLRVQHFAIPEIADPVELRVRGDVLHRIVHDRHQRDDGGERHEQEHGRDEEPGLLVDGLHWAAPPRSTRQLSA